MKPIFLGFIVLSLSACTQQSTEAPWRTDTELRDHLIAEAVFHGATEETAAAQYAVAQ